MKNAKDKNVTVNCRHVVVVDASHDEVKDYLEKIDSEFNTHYIDLLGVILVGDPTFRLDIDLEVTDLTWDKSYDTICSIDINGVKRSTMGRNWVIDEEPKCIIDSDSESFPKLGKFHKTWQNTGMVDQPIYDFTVDNEDDPLGKAVGSVKVTIPKMPNFLLENKYEDGVDILRITNTDDNHSEIYYIHNLEEDGLRQLGLFGVIGSLCDISNYGVDAEYIDRVTDVMRQINKDFNLGYQFEQNYSHEEMSEYTSIYSAELAEKLCVGRNVTFCFSLDVVEEELRLNPGATCDMKLHDVAMDYSDGIDYDKAYIVSYERCFR